jgi:RimJ/RimL family protein N-acetyltransferase
MKNPFLIGTHLYLRPLEREDAPLLAPWVNDPEVTRTLLIHRPVSLQAEVAFIDRVSQSEQDVVLGMVLKDGDRLIGAAGLDQVDVKNRHARFGMLIGDKGEWGKGYGTEATGLLVGFAFQTLNLNRVWLHVYEYNERGLRAYAKVGFRREGVLRQDTYREGRYWDTVVMGILRAEWEAGRRGPPEP